MTHAWQKYFLEHDENWVSTSVFARHCPKNTVNTVAFATKGKKLCKYLRKYRNFGLARRQQHRYLRCFFEVCVFFCVPFFGCLSSYTCVYIEEGCLSLWCCIFSVVSLVSLAVFNPFLKAFGPARVTAIIKNSNDSNGNELSLDELGFFEKFFRILELNSSNFYKF